MTVNVSVFRVHLIFSSRLRRSDSSFLNFLSTISSSYSTGTLPPHNLQASSGSHF